MRLYVLTILALLLTACGKPGEGRKVFAYTGSGEEWVTEAVPGSPAQTKPIFSSHPRPAPVPGLTLNPTVYYVPKIQADQARSSGCALSPAGDWQICASAFQECLMQGSCFVGMGDSWRYFMRDGRAETIKASSQGRCRFGVGYGACVIPNVSVAADLTMHKIGDVIYIPALDGKNVPYIGRHDGFFVVHDKGGGVRGASRFDFFTGHKGTRDPQNALARWGYGDKRNAFPYVKLSDQEAIAVKREKGIL